MNVLVVLAHPDPRSLTASVAQEIAEQLQSEHAVTLADLSAEGFSPTFTTADAQAYRTESPVPADVRREQERVSQSDAIVFVHPVYWWGVPALLKGWFERVLTNGWAYGRPTPDGLPAAALHGKQIHLVGLGASGADTYARHGYLTAMETTINHGLFEYCGAPVVSSRILHGAEREDITEDLPDFTAATIRDIRHALVTTHA